MRLGPRLFLVVLAAISLIFVVATALAEYSGT